MIQPSEVIAASIIGPAIALVGVAWGFCKGRAFGWQEGYFEREKRERERRGKDGRFISA